MYILTGSFLEFENAYLTYNEIITDKLSIIENIGEEVIVTEVEEYITSEDSEESIISKKMVFTLYISQLEYEMSNSIGSILSEINDYPNIDEASSEDLINYIIENDPRFSNLKLI